MNNYEGLGSIRKKPAPKKTGIGYKVFFLKNGKLYPPKVANPGGEDTPVGVWLDADAAPIVGKSKTGRPKVKAGGKGTQGGSGELAYRPGWHLGLIPYAIQFNREDENGEKTLFPKDFVWAEVEYAADKNYQKEAEAEGYTENGKYRHSYAGLKHLPTDGYYIYRTNPNPETDPWIITGAMKVNRILSKKEVDDLVMKAGREPQRVEEEGFTEGLGSLLGVSGIDEDFADKLNYFIENGYSLGNRYDYFSCGYANDILQACGLKSDIEIVITQSGMKKILGKKVGKKDNAHDLTPIEVLRLPQLIQKPILVINGNTSDTRLIFVEIPRRGRKMFAVVDLDINLFLGKQGKYNLIASVYSQENYKIVEKIISASVLNNIHYYDSTKIKSWLSEAGQLQLLPTITTNSMFSEKDFPNGANIRKNDEDTNKSKEKSKTGKESKKQIKGIGKLSNTDKLDDLAETQYRNRMKARIPDIDDYTLDEVAGKIYKENEYTHIRYTQNDFFQVDLDNLKRVHEFIMYMKEFFVKKTHWWLDILRLDADGYPIYIDFKGAFVFIETYKQYKDEWKKDFFYGDSVDYFVKSQYVMSHGDNDFSNIIMKLNHKPSVKAICDFIEKTAKKNEFSEKFIKELKEHIEKMDSDAIINKMINAYKRAFSPAKPSVPVVSDLYKYLDKSKLPNGEYRRTYSGIYYDDGYAVTTDGRFIFAHKKFYDKKNEGKIIDEIGKEIDGKYPNWRHFLLNESDKLKKLDIDRDELYKQILMYDKAYRYRDHKAPIEYFSIKDGDKIYPYSAKLLKGFLHQSMAYTNVSFYVSVSTNEYNRLNNMLIMKSDEGSYGIAAQLGTDNHEEMLDEVNNYGMMRDFGADGYPFILYSVYETGKHSKEKTKPNNIQLAKAKMKMAAARLKMMNMSLGEITYEMD